MHHSIKTIPYLTLSLGLLACPNPADKAPKAEVEDPATAAPDEGAASKPAADPSSALDKKPEGTNEDLMSLPINPDNSAIEFVGSKVTGSHEGGFKKFSGTVAFSESSLSASAVNVEIEMDSVFTDKKKLTSHLKSPDFFDVAKHPKSQFKLSKVIPMDKPAKDGPTHTLSGELSLRGVTKAITFPATIEVSKEKLTAKSEFSLNRKDFGIVYPGKKDDLIRDNVLLKLKVEADRPKAPPAG